MLAFRRVPSGLIRCGQRQFVPFLGLRSLFDELDHGYTVGPRVAVKAAKDHVALEFDVPRFKADEIKVSTRNGTLTVAGTKAQDSDAELRHHLYGDAPATTFARTFAIPRDLDLSKVQTALDHGVFTVTIPKAQPEPVEKVQLESNTPKAPEAPKEESALKVESTSTSPSLMDNLSRMSWPPKMKVVDGPRDVKFTVNLPESVTKENLDLRLQGRSLNVSVNHVQKVEKKNRAGQVVFSEQQSVSYSTPLVVPEGTRASDISTQLEAGVLTISIAKHGEAEQAVKVN